MSEIILEKIEEQVDKIAHRMIDYDGQVEIPLFEKIIEVLLKMKQLLKAEEQEYKWFCDGCSYECKVKVEMKSKDGYCDRSEKMNWKPINKEQVVEIKRE